MGAAAVVVEDAAAAVVDKVLPEWSCEKKTVQCSLHFQNNISGFWVDNRFNSSPISSPLCTMLNNYVRCNKIIKTSVPYFHFKQLSSTCD